MTSRMTKKSFAVGGRRTWQRTTQGFAISFAICVGAVTLLPGAAWAELTDDVINSGMQRTRDAIASQLAIDELQDATDKILSLFDTQEKAVESLTRYNDRLRRTLDAQQVAMNELEQSIEDASLIERQIVPLMLRMISGLERFIGSDAPFKLQERQDRVERIKGYLTNANITAAERFRQVLGAYSIENGYGNSIDVYNDTLDLAGQSLSVNIFQVGRSGLYYQTLDGDQSGYWDKSSDMWTELDSSHNAGISHAIRIAQGKVSPGLMMLPIAAPEAF
jgi:hypothetical protein